MYGVLGVCRDSVVRWFSCMVCWVCMGLCFKMAVMYGVLGVCLGVVL